MPVWLLFFFGITQVEWNMNGEPILWMTSDIGLDREKRFGMSTPTRNSLQPQTRNVCIFTPAAIPLNLSPGKFNYLHRYIKTCFFQQKDSYFIQIVLEHVISFSSVKKKINKIFNLLSSTCIRFAYSRIKVRILPEDNSIKM